MFCPNCGKEISKRAKFCRECGTDLTNSKDKRFKESLPGRGGPIRIIKVFFVLVIVFATLLCGLYFMRGTRVGKHQVRRKTSVKNADKVLGEETTYSETSIYYDGFPDGFDGVKWGMGFDKVLKIIKDEGKQVVSADYNDILVKYEFGGLEADVKYGFTGNTDMPSNLCKLTSIKIHWPYRHGRTKVCLGGRTKYGKLKEILTKKYGPPSSINEDTKEPDKERYRSTCWYYPELGHYDAEYGARIYLNCISYNENGQTWLTYNAPHPMQKQFKKQIQKFSSEDRKHKEQDFRKRF